MRIAVVTETWAPEINGVALTVRSFVEQLVALGHGVRLVRPRQSARAPVAPPQVVETLVAGAALPLYPRLRFGFPCAGRLRRDWSVWRPDAIYVATEGPLGWSAVAAARALGVPCATGFHTRFHDFVRHYGLPVLGAAVFAGLRRFHNGADATLVPTFELKRTLERGGFADVRLLPRAVDTALFTPARRSEALRRQWGIGEDGLAVVHVGRVAPEKNLALAVRAFEAIRGRVPSARFVWVGDGPSLDALRRAHPDFVFCGMRHGIELAEHFASADLFLFPSLTETFGNVTLEALASGVPTIAFDSGAAHERIVDGVHGRTVPIGRSDRFVGVAVDVATDAQHRAALAANARRNVEGLTPAGVAMQLAALLGSLAPKRRADVGTDALADGDAP